MTSTDDGVRVNGGAGGAAAHVEDVDTLGRQLADHARGLDPGQAGALLAAAMADAAALAVLAPGPAARVADVSLQAGVLLASTSAILDGLVISTRLAAEAYAGTEAAVASSWHLAASTLLPFAAEITVVTAIEHELGAMPVGALEAAAVEMTLDGLAQQMTRPVDDAPVATVDTGALATVCRDLGAALPTSSVDVEAVGARPVAPAGSGLAGLVEGIDPQDDGDVTVRHRQVSGPDGHREVYVVDLPGTDEWSPWHASPSPRDVQSSLDQLGGTTDDAYVHGVLAVIDTLPPGATIVLCGHSLGGITASTVAALAARRGRSVQYVVTAGSPVDTMRVPHGTTVVSLQNRADLVPSLDGRPAHDVAGRTTITADVDRGSAPANHEVELYAQVGAEADRMARTDPGLRATLDAMLRDGAITRPGDVVDEQSTRWRITRRRG